MTAKKIIYTICLLILLPLAVYSQDPRRAPKRKVVLPSGDTIVTSNKGGSSLLSKEDMKFFKRDNTNLDKLVDSLYNLNSSYNSLEDAANQVTGMLDKIEVEQVKEQENKSLSFRLSQKNKDRLKKEREAQSVWEEKKKEERLSVEDIVESYEKFGDKPTYYINGTQVDERMINQLRPMDILSRQFKVVNTVSGNPNGEVWYEVSVPVAQKVLVGESPKTATKSKSVKEIKENRAIGAAGRSQEKESSKVATKSVKDTKEKRSKEAKKDTTKETKKSKDKEDKAADKKQSPSTKKTRAQILQEANDLLKDSGK